MNENNDMDSIKCDVCLWNHITSEDDQIVLCDECNVACHQSCYGDDLVGVKAKDLENMDFIC